MNRLRTTLLTVLLLIISAHVFAAPSKDLWKRWTVNDPLSTKTIDHSHWQAFLQKYVKPNSRNVNLVDYAGVNNNDEEKLDQYLRALQAIDIDNYNRNVQMAYWINLYNALTIDVVLQHYPVDSIKDINISPGFFSVGPWDRKLVEVEGIKLSLNDIEHRILRPIWNDPRVNYALNCASIGCPNLQTTVFSGANLDPMLTKAATDYINSNRGVYIIDDKLSVSKIYKWFEEDFGGTDQDVIKHLKIYAKPNLRSKLSKINKISDSTYNWNLNAYYEK